MIYWFLTDHRAARHMLLPELQLLLHNAYAYFPLRFQLLKPTKKMFQASYCRNYKACTTCLWNRSVNVLHRVLHLDLICDSSKGVLMFFVCWVWIFWGRTRKVHHHVVAPFWWTHDWNETWWVEQIALHFEDELTITTLQQGGTTLFKKRPSVHVSGLGQMAKLY